MEELYNSIGVWVKSAFPDAGSVEHLLKLRHEAVEAINSPGDITEYADCLIALLGASYKAGIGYNDLLKETKSKLMVNTTRNWKKESDGTYQHVV
jgi:hypothetical protein